MCNTLACSSYLIKVKNIKVCKLNVFKQAIILDRSLPLIDIVGEIFLNNINTAPSFWPSCNV